MPTIDIGVAIGVGLVALPALVAALYILWCDFAGPWLAYRARRWQADLEHREQLAEAEHREQLAALRKLVTPPPSGED